MNLFIYFFHRRSDRISSLGTTDAYIHTHIHTIYNLMVELRNQARANFFYSVCMWGRGRVLTLNLLQLELINERERKIRNTISLLALYESFVRALKISDDGAFQLLFFYIEKSQADRPPFFSRHACVTLIFSLLLLLLLIIIYSNSFYAQIYLAKAAINFITFFPLYLSRYHRPTV